MVSDDHEINFYDLEKGHLQLSIDTPMRRNYSADHALWSIANDQYGRVFVGNTNTHEVMQFDPVIQHTECVRFDHSHSVRVNMKPWFIAANSSTKQILVSNLKDCRVDVIRYDGQKSPNAEGGTSPLRRCAA